MIKTAALIFLLLPISLVADEPRGVPQKLFDVPLGHVVDFGSGENQNIGNLPVKEHAGSQKFLGHGFHFYFKPLRNNPAFKHIPYPIEDSEYHTTSYRLYLLPIIPDSITKATDIDKAMIKWEVILIEWYIPFSEVRDDEARNADFYWASELCETVAIDIGVEPDTFDYYEMKTYTCTFTEGDRTLEISSREGRRLRLSYRDEVAEAKDSAVDRKIRKLRIEDIRPY